MGTTSLIQQVLLNDDLPPTLNIVGLNPLINESSEGFELEIETSDASGTFFGKYITSVPYDVDLSFDLTNRENASISTVSAGAQNLNETNDFRTIVQVNPSLIGDFRAFRSFTTRITADPIHNSSPPMTSMTDIDIDAVSYTHLTLPTTPYV